jgi:hypothetical protein
MGKRKPAATGRFGVYLDENALQWLHQTRGKFLLLYGQDITTTNIVRAGIEQLREMDETRLLKLLESYRGRRRAAT